MIKILGNRILVSRVLEEKNTDEFNAVEIQDSFVYKGKIEQSHVDDMNHGDIVLFAKYSPDTHEVDVDGVKMKIVNVDDILAIYKNN